MVPSRVLIVEDDAVLAAHLSRMLLQMGYQVTDLVATGETAIRSAQAQPPDVILMDILLRGEITGIQAAEEIHKSADIPIVYLTAYTTDTYIQQAKITNAYAYMTKPVRAHELHASLEMALYKSQSEKRIQHLNRVLRAVRDITRLVTREHDPGHLLDAACETLLLTQGYKLVWIDQWVGNRLEPIAIAGEDRALIELITTTASQEQAENLPRMEALRTQQPVICEDLANDERYAPWAETVSRAKLSRQAVIPMLNDGRIYGILSVFSEHAAALKGDDETELLLELATDLAFGLKSIQDEAERNRIEAALQKQETLLREVLENSQDVVYRRNLLTDRYEYLSPSLSEILGIAAGSLITLPFAEVLGLIHPDDRGIVERELREASLNHEIYSQVEYRLKHTNGDYIWCQDRFSIQSNSQGKPEYIVGSLREINAQKQAQMALRESEARFSGIFNASPVSIIISRLSDDRIMNANPAFCNTLGLKPEQVLEHSWKELDLFLDQATAKLMLEKLVSHNDIDLLELTYHTSAGEIKYGLLSAVLINLGGEDCVLIMGQDITQRKQLERDLQEKTDFLTQVISAMGQGLTVTGPDTRFELVNPAYARFVGYPAEDLIGKHPKELTFQEDQAVLEEALAIRQRGEANSYESRLVHTDGHLTPVLINGVPRLRNGQMVGAIAVITDLSALKYAELSLRQSEERYRSFINQSADAVSLSDEQGFIIEWNPAAEKITGVPAATALGLPLWEINLLMLPADKRTAQQMEFNRQSVQRLLETGTGPMVGKYFNIELERPDGKRRFLRQIVFSIQTDLGFRIGSTARDITETTLAERAVRQSEELKRAVLNSLEAHIAVLDHDGNILEVNEPWLRFASENGIRDPEHTVVHVNYLDVLRRAQMSGDEGVGELLQQIQEVLSGTNASFQADYPCNTPSRPYWFTMKVVRLSEFQSGAVITHEDITLRKQAETALQSANNELEQRVQLRTSELQEANSALNLALRAKNEFMAAMSHELRTPLNGILGSTQVLQLPNYGVLSEKQSMLIDNIEKSGQRLLALVNGILDYTLLQSSKPTLDSKYVSLGELCQMVLQTVAPKITQKQQRSYLKLTPDEISIQTDPRRVQQILFYLLDNASKFTPDGGELGIEIVGHPEEKVVKITVWDQGIGIKAEDFPHLFQPFVQLDARLARVYEGVGLGLMLAKRLAELLGGSLEVESTFGLGSRFTVTLFWNG